MPIKNLDETKQLLQSDLLFSQLDFLSWEVNENELILNFRLGKVEFQHRDQFSINLSNISDTKAFQKLAIFYGIAKLFKYTQFFLVQKVFIHQSILNQPEKNFWQDYFDNYSMELFYSQQINLKYLPKLNFISSNQVNLNVVTEKKSTTDQKKSTVLLGVGGGKDAIYAFELLEKSNIATDLFFSYDREANFKLRNELSQKMANQHHRQIYSVKMVENEPESISQVIEKQKKQGIKPSSPAASTNAIRMAIIALDKGYVQISTCNEKSADYGNTVYCNKEVNHQFSKSLIFEQQLNNLLQNFFPREINYFSVLKPIYEIRIAQGFAKLEQYFPYFNSCNLNPEHWCLNCPKCAFVFTLLAGFLSPAKTMSIFEENLFEKASLETTFLELMGLKGVKPLECVGEKEEVWLAMAGAINNGHKGKILDIFIEKILPKISINELQKKYLKINSSPGEHNIPTSLLEKIQWF